MVIPTRPGESEEEAEARSEELGWRLDLALLALASLPYYAFIISQA